MLAGGNVGILEVIKSMIKKEDITNLLILLAPYYYYYGIKYSKTYLEHWQKEQDLKEQTKVRKKK